MTKPNPHIATIAAIDREIDANMAALFMRVRCALRDCAGFETAYRRCPDLEARRDELMRRRGEAQVLRDREEHRRWQQEQRRERARLRKIKTPQPSPVMLACITVGDLERLAGVADRAAFWQPFARHTDGFQRGVSTLTAMVEARTGLRRAA